MCLIALEQMILFFFLMSNFLSFPALCRLLTRRRLIVTFIPWKIGLPRNVMSCNTNTRHLILQRGRGVGTMKNSRTQLMMYSMKSMKLVFPSRFISWTNSFSDISRKCILPNMIRGGTILIIHISKMPLPQSYLVKFAP